MNYQIFPSRKLKTAPQPQSQLQSQPNSFPEVDSKKIKAENRPAYTSIRPPLEEKQLNTKFAGLRGNLTWRLVIHVAITTFCTLLVLGIAIVAIGTWNINRAESEQSRNLIASFQSFTKQQEQDGTITTTANLIRAFMRSQSNYPTLGMLGYIGNDLKFYRHHYNRDIYDDKELVESIAKQFNNTNITLYYLSTTTNDYVITSIPVQVKGSETGHFVVVDKHSDNIQPVVAIGKIYTALSLLVLLLTIIITTRTSVTMLHPIKEMRETLNSINSEQDLSKRLPISSDTDLGELAKQANSMLGRMQSVFDQEQQLLNDVRHEIRTPITALRVNLELMDVNNPADCAKSRQMGLEQLDLLQRLTESLETTAQIDRPDFVRPHLENLTDLTLDIYEMVQSLGNFQWKLEPLCEAEAYVDRQRIIQAVLQLAQNASKFTQPGSPIWIGMSVDKAPLLKDSAGAPVLGVSAISPTHENSLPETPDCESLYIWVRDNGIGIEEKNQHRIFDRFARVDHKIPGSGLGLTIVNAIAQAHGGNLSVKSRIGIGSVFTLEIPLVKHL